MAARRIIEEYLYINPETGRRLTSFTRIARLTREDIFPVPEELLLSPSGRLILNNNRNRNRFFREGFALTEDNRVVEQFNFRIEGTRKQKSNSEKDWINNDLLNEHYVRDLIVNNNIRGNYRITYIPDLIRKRKKYTTTVYYKIPQGSIYSWWNKDFLYMDWFERGGYGQDTVFYKGGSGTIYFTKSEDLIPQRYFQYFQEGESNCLLNPILNYFKNKLEKSESSKNKQIFKSKIKKIECYMKEYENGVPQDKIQDVANTLNVAINIMDVAGNNFIEHKPKGKQYNTFNMINSRIGHVDLFTNISWSDRTIISEKEYEKIVEKLINSGTFFTFTKNTIHTNDKYYSIKSNEEVEEWEQEQNIDKMEYFVNTELSEFVRSANHFGGCFDFVESPFKNINNLDYLDHKKSYANYKKCEYYKKYKFTESPSVYQKLPKDFNYKKYGGFYLINNINDKNVSENIKQYMNYLKIVNNDIIYGAPYINFLEDLGYKFDIIAGAYSFGKQDIDMTKLVNIDKMQYKIWSGKQCMIALDKIIKLYGSKELSNQLAYDYGKDRVEYYKDNLEITLTTRKKKCYHRAHVSAYILDYSRIQILEQLFKIPFNKVRRIQLDGIYFEKCEVKKIKTFKYKNKEIKYKKNKGSESYFNTYNGLSWNPPEYDYQFTYKHLLASGQGGSGKTHFYLNSKHLVNPLYCAPTNKLIRSKVDEYKLDNYCTWAKLIGDNCDPYFGNTNTIILDEISMLTEEKYNKIVNKYPNSLIIFSGDPGYQLPSHTGTPINWDNKDVLRIKYNKNYRVKDKKLKNILKYARELIEKNISTEENNRLLLEKLKKRETTDKDYTIDDYIITGTHKRIEYYTNKHKSKGNKWLVNKTTKDYCTGDVLIQESMPACSDLRHAFTAHATQGETIRQKIYIDSSKLFAPQMFYTVLSRAQYLNQIHII